MQYLIIQLKKILDLSTFADGVFIQFMCKSSAMENLNQCMRFSIHRQYEHDVIICKVSAECGRVVGAKRSTHTVVYHENLSNYLKFETGGKCIFECFFECRVLSDLCADLRPEC
jgi:hypothetical protein